MKNYTQKHLTSSVIMVQPVDFGYNQQTGLDNEFQHRPSSDQSSKITQSAMDEFFQMAKQLNDYGIETLQLAKNHTDALLPDAVFPNNWFSTRNDGKLFIYPMKTPNRQAEVQLAQLSDKLLSADYQISEVIDLRSLSVQEEALEGTGSLIFHHPSGTLFAAHSERCQPDLLAKFAQDYHYQLLSFNTSSQQGAPIYHTNVMMSCGQNFAVVTEAIVTSKEQQKQLRATLEDTIEELIIISEEQMSQHFCGNIIQLQNSNSDPCIVMSSSAYHGFSTSQKKQLEKHGELIVCHIPTIEYVGGGSARCMIAENFLPKKC